MSEREIDMNMHYKQLKRTAIFSAGPRATNGLHAESCRSSGECGRKVLQGVERGQGGTEGGETRRLAACANKQIAADLF